MHSNIECNFLLSGSADYFAGGRFHTVGTGVLTVFWAGMPHEMVRVTPDAEMVWIVLPLTWFLQWQLPTAFTNQLLKGKFVRASSPETLSDGAETPFSLDKALILRWVDDMRVNSPSTNMKNIVMLEVQALIMRLAAQTTPPIEKRPMDFGDATSVHVEALASYISQHYRDDVSVADIAKAAGLHPNYAMQVFKQGCGMSIWDYLVRLRVSHAQRLLISTDLKIGQIAMQSGFNSMTRFYATFAEISGRTPREFRKIGLDG